MNNQPRPRNGMGGKIGNRRNQSMGPVFPMKKINSLSIYVSGVQDIKSLESHLKAVAEGKYSLTFQSKQTVKIVPESKRNYRAIILTLERNGFEFYSLKPRQNETFSVVLGNVNRSVEYEEIKKKLEPRGHKVVRITRVPYPLYLVELELKENNAEIFKIKYLEDMQVTFVPPQYIGEIAPKDTGVQRPKPKGSFNCTGNRLHSQPPRTNPFFPASQRGCTEEKKTRSSWEPKLCEKTPSAPPLSPKPEGHHAPYGFTNVGQPQPQGPYTQPPTGPPGYNYQPGYSSPHPGYIQPQPGYNAPQPGYVQPQPNYMPGQPGYGSPQSVPSVSHPGQTETVTVQPQGNTTVVVLGGCPTCRTGTLEDNFTCLGVCCAIVFFPVGILCCLAMKEKRCTNCHSTF